MSATTNKRQQKISREALLAWKACERLAASPRNQRPDSLLTPEEYAAAVLALRSAADCCRQYHGRRFPKTFVFGGKRFYLATSNLGRVFLGRFEGERVLASGYGSI